MKIYLDLLFLMNFILDFLLIYASADILSIRTRLFRITAAAASGAVLGVCFFMTDMRFSGSLAVSLLTGAGMIFMAFGRCRLKEFLKRLAMLYIVSALFAGAAFFDMTMFGKGMIKNGIFYFSSPRIIIVCAIVYFAARYASVRLKRRASSQFCRIKLEYMGRKVETKAMTDTGNGLLDPVSKKPVMLLELDTLRELIGAQIFPENLCEWVEKERLRIIPYRTIDTEGILYGVVLDRAVVDGRIIDGAVAAVSKNSLKYPVILHAGM